MKAIIFCGGKGIRFNNGKPGDLKPLIKVAGVPILERIIYFFKKHGIDQIILLGGYKFNELQKFAKKFNSINVNAIFTGVNTNTGGRLLKIKNIIKNENFFLTYGDSLIDHNLKKIINEKKLNKKNFYVCSYNYEFSYGVFKIKYNNIKNMSEKKINLPINSGFYLLDKRIFQFIKNNNDSFEKDVIKRLLINNKIKLKAIKINYWKPMDNLEDKFALERILIKKNIFNYKKIV